MPADRQRLGQDAVDGARDHQSDSLEIVARKGLGGVRAVFLCRLAMLKFGDFSQRALQRLSPDRSSPVERIFSEVRDVQVCNCCLQELARGKVAVTWRGVYSPQSRAIIDAG